jgi:hypothetical protein
LSRVPHVPKIRDRKQRIDIDNYSFVNKSIENWDQISTEALGLTLKDYACKPRIFRKRVRKAITNGLK